MFVKYTPRQQHIKVVPVVSGSGNISAAESVVLNPGTNEVSDEKWEKIKASLASEIADGTVKPFSVETKKSGQAAKAKTLKDVPAKTAAMIVSSCSNKDTLRSWFKDTLPDEIALLVVRRMRQLNMDIDEISGEENALSDSDIIDEGNGNSASGKPEDAKKDGSDTGKKNSEKVSGNNSKTGSAKKAESDGADEIPDFDNPDVKVK